MNRAQGRRTRSAWVRPSGAIVVPPSKLPLPASKTSEERAPKRSKRSEPKSVRNVSNGGSATSRGSSPGAYSTASTRDTVRWSLSWKLPPARQNQESPSWPAARASTRAVASSPALRRSLKPGVSRALLVTMLSTPETAPAP